MEAECCYKSTCSVNLMVCFVSLLSDDIWMRKISVAKEVKKQQQFVSETSDVFFI